jgi:hypothetical protein
MLRSQTLNVYLTFHSKTAYLRLQWTADSIYKAPSYAGTPDQKNNPSKRFRENPLLRGEKPANPNI